MIEVGGYPENVYVGNCYREESDLNFRLLHRGYHFLSTKGMCKPQGAKKRRLQGFFIFNVRIL